MRPLHSLSRVFTRRAFAAIIAAGLLAVAACSAGTTANGAPGNGTPGSPSTLPSTFMTISALQKALQDKGITCKLEYPGLSDDVAQVELSICVIDGEQAYLKIWLKPEKIKMFLDSPDGQTGTVAVGSNWTITVVSNALAAKIARAIGGTAPSGSATPTAPSSIATSLNSASNPLHWHFTRIRTSYFRIRLD